MQRARLEFFVLLFVGIISGGFLLIIGAKYVLPVVSPFLIAWVVAMATRTPSERLSEKIRVPKKVLRLFISLLSLLTVFSVAVLGVWQGAVALWSFLSDMGEGGFSQVLRIFTGAPLAQRLGIDSELFYYIEGAIEGMISRALGLLADVLSSWVGFIPKALFFLLVTVIALIYFALDLERINEWVRSVLPEKAARAISDVRIRFFTVVKKYLRSYVLLMLISFGIVLSGLLLLGVKHAFVISAVIALLDILPVIGVGTALIPWSVICFITGDVALGIGLAVLFCVNAVVRQLAEPKIVGKSLDMHPILTLLLLYAGYYLLGIAGLLLVPFAALLLGIILGKREGELSQ